MQDSGEIIASSNEATLAPSYCRELTKRDFNSGCGMYLCPALELQHAYNKVSFVSKWTGVLSIIAGTLELLFKS